MTKIAIVTSSIRPGRQSLNVANWVKSLAEARQDATFEIVDIADFNLPVWAEAAPPAYADAQNPDGKAFAEKIAEFDGYIFAVAEYNHSMTGAFKNALDYLGPKHTANKAAAMVSWGSAGGARAVEHLRGVLSELQIAHVRSHVLLSMFTDFENFSTLKPGPAVVAGIEPMLDQLLVWTRAMEQVRAGEFDLETVGANA